MPQQALHESLALMQAFAGRSHSLTGIAEIAPDVWRVRQELNEGSSSMVNAFWHSIDSRCPFLCNWP
ncbi:MAG: hypothetical protein OHK0011_20340 [Turneriella sp.]